MPDDMDDTGRGRLPGDLHEPLDAQEIRTEGRLKRRNRVL